MALFSAANVSPSCCFADTWDVDYEGVDSAADNVANYLRWDSAIDDDWTEPNDSFKLNTPSPGYMSVDRVTNPADHIKTGNIWIRDPILASSLGFTIEVGVKILPNSNLNAFSMTYLDDAGSFGVHLSPDQIKAGDLAAGGTGSTIVRNTTDDFHTYRIVQLPNSHTIRVYIDNNPTPVMTSAGDTNYAVGSSPYLLYPRVLIGDNENNTVYNANYVMDFVRYHRGATAPGQTQSVLSPRVLPALPAPAPLSETWTNGYYGQGTPTSQGWIQAGGDGFTQQPGGVMGLNTLSSPTNARLDNVPGWTNQAGITIEARIKVLPNSQEGGFDLVANDSVGDTSLVLSPNKVQLMHAYFAVGEATYTMNTTDDFHIYRLTRPANGLYWQLYIDNNQVATIQNQHSGGDQIPFSRIWFGDVAFPIPNNGTNVLIDYIRWHEGDSAPPIFTPGDFNQDGVVDASDYNVWRQSFGSTTSLKADANGNGVVDAADYVVWRNHAAGGTGAGLNGAVAVPEPATLFQVWAVAILVFGSVRKRSSVDT